jgi:hypothetical protein
MYRIFIFIVSGMLLLPVGANAAETVFMCKNVNNSFEREFTLKIDIDKKTMNRGGVTYKNIEIYDNEIVAIKLYKFDGSDNEIVLRFNRMTGNLMYRHYRSIALYDRADYLCNKKLI